VRAIPLCRCSAGGGFSLSSFVLFYWVPADTNVICYAYLFIVFFCICDLLNTMLSFVCVRVCVCRSIRLEMSIAFISVKGGWEVGRLCCCCWWWWCCWLSADKCVAVKRCMLRRLRRICSDGGHRHSVQPANLQAPGRAAVQLRHADRPSGKFLIGEMSWPLPFVRLSASAGSGGGDTAQRWCEPDRTARCWCNPITIVKSRICLIFRYRRPMKTWLLSSSRSPIFNFSTRSSAVAERPHDSSCLSVVNFNSTIPRAQSFVISNFGFRFTNAYS